MLLTEYRYLLTRSHFTARHTVDLKVASSLHFSSLYPEVGRGDSHLLFLIWMLIRYFIVLKSHHLHLLSAGTRALVSSHIHCLRVMSLQLRKLSGVEKVSRSPSTHTHTHAHQLHGRDWNWGEQWVRENNHTKLVSIACKAVVMPAKAKHSQVVCFTLETSTAHSHFSVPWNRPTL